VINDPSRASAIRLAGCGAGLRLPERVLGVRAAHDATVAIAGDTDHLCATTRMRMSAGVRSGGVGRLAGRTGVASTRMRRRLVASAGMARARMSSVCPPSRDHPSDVPAISAAAIAARMHRRLTRFPSGCAALWRPASASVSPDRVEKSAADATTAKEPPGRTSQERLPEALSYVALSGAKGPRRRAAQSRHRRTALTVRRGQ